MPYRDSLASWAVIRLLPDMQRAVVGRFRKESDAEGHRQALCRLNSDASFRVVFDTPQDLENIGKRLKTMEFKIGDLVRDGIPDVLRAENQRCEAAPMPSDEFLSKLKDLLLRKSLLVADALSRDVRSEVADLYDILDCLLAAYKIDHLAVEHERFWRRENLGGFDKRLKLVWLEPE